MGDEADYAEAESWGLGYAMNAPHGGYNDDTPQTRSFLNPRGLSRHAQRLEEAEQRLAMMPQISINRGGIQFPTADEAKNLVKKFNENFPNVRKWAEKMRSTEDILAEATAMREEAERLERMADEREKYGADPFKNGTVLKVDMKYRTGNLSYAYAVIKIAGKFYLSGRLGSNMSVDTRTGGMTWENFVAWLSQGDATVWQAGSLKQVL